MEKQEEKKYVSVDIEASGRIPGKNSMMSLGACLVDNLNTTFYRELKPISNEYLFEGIRVGSLGLRCLDDLKHLDEYNANSKGFKPEKVLEVLYDRGEEPKKVMSDYASWVLDVTKGYKPIEAAAPIKFDAMFTNWYFNMFYDKENPFGFSGEDMNSIYRGLVRNLNASMKDLGLRDERGLPHNALEDAIQQAKEFRVVLTLLKSKEIILQ